MHTLTIEKSFAKDFTLVLLASFFICLCGQISIPLWFTPVPLATQNTAVLLVAAVLGAKRGFFATLAFLFQGALGLGVFSGGLGGAAMLVGPRGGYLVGYLIASFVVGYIVEKYRRPVLALTLGNGIIWILGASYLATFVGPLKALLLGVVPFVFGDILKTVVGLRLIRKFLPFEKSEV